MSTKAYPYLRGAKSTNVQQIHDFKENRTSPNIYTSEGMILPAGGQKNNVPKQWLEWKLKFIQKSKQINAYSYRRAQFTKTHWCYKHVS